MKQEKLNAIAEQSASNLVALITEHADDIIADIAAIAEEAQLQGKEKLTIRLAHTITLDLGDDQQTDRLAWNVARKVETVSRIPDPDQPELPSIAAAVEKLQDQARNWGTTVKVEGGAK